jgi:hypothetical protein
MDLLFLRNKRRQRQSDGPAMTAFIYDAHIELFKAKWLRRSQSRSKVAQGLCKSLCSLALKKKWFKNLPFLLSLEAFPIKRHLLLLLGKMDKNVWTGFYFIFIKFRKEKETALRQTKNKRQCHEQDVKIHYSTHLTPSCFERQRMKEWEIDGIGMGCETVRETERKRDGWNLIYDSRSEFFGFFSAPLTPPWPFTRWLMDDHTVGPFTTTTAVSPSHGYRTDGSVVRLAVIKYGMTNSARPWLPLFTQDDSLTW